MGNVLFHPCLSYQVRIFGQWRDRRAEITWEIQIRIIYFASKKSSGNGQNSKFSVNFQLDQFFHWVGGPMGSVIRGILFLALFVFQARCTLENQEYLKGTNFRAYLFSRNFAQRPKNARNLIPKLCAVLRCAKINTEFWQIPPENRKITQNH